MFHFPSFRRIAQAQEITQFSAAYLQCSGFKVPQAYYESNQVFAVNWKGTMIGGFVLGTGAKLRTLEVFASDECRESLYQNLQKTDLKHTEMCCFWIDPRLRNKTSLNFFVWFCVAFALQMYGSEQLIFGTNSGRLATLYRAAPKSALLHTDLINHKQTYIFSGPRKHCLSGVVQILGYKIKRLLVLRANANAPAVVPAGFRQVGV